MIDATETATPARPNPQLPALEKDAYDSIAAAETVLHSAEPLRRVDDLNLQEAAAIAQVHATLALAQAQLRVAEILEQVHGALCDQNDHSADATAELQYIADAVSRPWWRKLAGR